MKSLKIHNYQVYYFIVIFILLGFVNQRGIQAQCINLEVTSEYKSGIPSICQDGVIYRLQFSNTGAPFIAGGTITVTTDPSGNDFVTIEKIISHTGFDDFTGLGSGQLTASHPGFNGQTSYYLEIELGFSCDLWDNMDQLTGYEIEVTGWEPLNTCFQATSESFDIGYAIVEPYPLTVPVIFADLGETIYLEYRLIGPR